MATVEMCGWSDEEVQAWNAARAAFQKASDAAGPDGAIVIVSNGTSAFAKGVKKADFERNGLK